MELNSCVFLRQIQFQRQVLLASSHEASDGDHRCLYDTQQPLAREEGELAEQEGHTARHIVLRASGHTLNIYATVPSVVHSYYFTTGPY